MPQSLCAFVERVSDASQMQAKRRVKLAELPRREVDMVRRPEQPANLHVERACILTLTGYCGSV